MYLHINIYSIFHSPFVCICLFKARTQFSHCALTFPHLIGCRFPFVSLSACCGIATITALGNLFMTPSHVDRCSQPLHLFILFGFRRIEGDRGKGCQPGYGILPSYQVVAPSPPCTTSTPQPPKGYCCCFRGTTGAVPVVANLHTFPSALHGHDTCWSVICGGGMSFALCFLAVAMYLIGGMFLQPCLLPVDCQLFIFCCMGDAC